MSEVEAFTRQLAINQDLNSLMHEAMPEEQANIHGIWKLNRDITAISRTNNFLQDYYVYLNNYNLILAPGSSYFRPEHYYESFHYRDISRKEWEQDWLGKTHRSDILPAMPYSKMGVETSVISYIQSLPLESLSPTAATAVVLIDQEQVNSLLTVIPEQYGGWAHIMDGQGHTIGLQGIDQAHAAQLETEAASKLEADKVSQMYNDTLLITIRSEKNGWVYRAGIPREALMKNANKIKDITWAVTGTALLLGIIAGLLLAYRNSLPITKLLSIFSQESRGVRNDYDFLQGNISGMITNNKRLESELNLKLPLLRDAFLRRLVAGEFLSGSEIEAAANQAGVMLSGQAGYAGLLKITGYEDMNHIDVLNELNAARLLVKQTLQDVDGSLLMTDLGSNQVIIVFLIAEEAGGAREEQISRIVEQSSRSLYDQYKIRVAAAIGSSFSELRDVSRSHEQAKEAIAYTDPKESRMLVWFDEIQIDSTTFYYPLDVELRLISTIKAGDGEKARSILEDTAEQNLERRNLSAEMKRQFILELKGTLLKLLDQKPFHETALAEPMKERMLGMAGGQSMESALEEIGTMMDTLTDWINTKKNSEHNETIEQIRQCMADMYMQPELSLYQVAERVGYPEKYISGLFKEVTGTNLWDYLEKLRIDQAVRLLRESSSTIEDIAQRTGYNSAHSFRRAFKRAVGVSPSAYRQFKDED